MKPVPRNKEEKAYLDSVEDLKRSVEQKIIDQHVLLDEKKHEARVAYSERLRSGGPEGWRMLQFLKSLPGKGWPMRKRADEQ